MKKQNPANDLEHRSIDFGHVSNNVVPGALAANSAPGLELDELGSDFTVVDG